jgi:uncharacterized protein (TIGR02217 family)
MPDFLETPRFPACPKYGVTSEPDYSVTVISRAGGHERRNRNWSRPLTRVTITVGPGPRADDEIQELLEFWHAVGGMAIGFRYKDEADYKSCRVSGTVSKDDQPLVLIAGSPQTYQMVKRYTAGAQTQDREIYKPVSGTILIAVNGVQKTENTDYTIDYTTGVVEFLTPLPGSPVTPDLTWGGEFDIPVRFDSTFPVEQVSFEIQAASFTLQELRV